MSESARLSVTLERNKPVSVLDEIFANYEGATLLNLFACPANKGDLKAYYEFATPEVRDQALEDLNGKPPHNLEMSVAYQKGNRNYDKRNGSFHSDGRRGSDSQTGITSRQMSQENLSPNTYVLPQITVYSGTESSKLSYPTSANSDPEVVDLTDVVNAQPIESDQTSRHGFTKPPYRNDKWQRGSNFDKLKGQGDYQSRHGDNGRPFRGEQRFNGGDRRPTGRGAYLRNEYEESRKPGFSHSEDGPREQKGRGSQFFNNDTFRNERPQRSGNENGKPKRMGYNDERPKRSDSFVSEDNLNKHNKERFSPTKNDGRQRKGDTEVPGNNNYTHSGKSQVQGSFSKDDRRKPEVPDGANDPRSKQQGSFTKDRRRPESQMSSYNDSTGKQRGFKNDFGKQNRENENVSNDSGRNKRRDFKKDHERQSENETVSSSDPAKSNARNFQNDRKRSDNQFHNDDSGKQKANFQNDRSRRSDGELSSNNFDESRGPKGRGPHQKKDFGGKRQEARVDNKENDLRGSDGNFAKQNGEDTHLQNGTEFSPRPKKFDQNHTRPKHDGRRSSLNAKSDLVVSSPSTPAEVKHTQHTESPAAQDKTTPTSRSVVPRLPRGQYSEVMITSIISPGFFYVHDIKDARKIAEMHKKIQELAPDLPEPPKVSVGDKCLAKFHLDGAWYRARVISVDDGKTTVAFVDYGNEDQTNEFKVLPGELVRGLPPWAFKIKFSDRTPKELLNKKDEDKIEVMPLDKKEGEDFYLVEVRHEGSSAVAKCTDISDDCVSFKVKEQVKELASCASTSKAKQMSVAAHTEPCPIPENTYSETSKSKTNAEFKSSTRLPRSAMCPIAKNAVSDRLAASVQKPCPLDRNSYTQVSITCVWESGVYYVHTSTKDEESSALFRDVGEAGKSATALSNPSVGAVCFACYLGDWYRAKILSVTPTLKVRLIDWGDEIEITLDSLKEITPELKKKPEFIFKIKLAENASECHFSKAVYGKFKVKPLRFEEDYWIVAVEGDPIPSASVTESDSSVRREAADVSSVPTQAPISADDYTSAEASQSAKKPPVEVSAPLCPIDLNEYSELMITCALTNYLYFGQPSTKKAEIAKLHVSVQKEGSVAPKLLAPNVGGLCLAKYEDEWYRAKILSRNSASVSVQLLDYGDKVEISSEDLKEISAASKDVPVHCFQFKLADSTSEKHLDKKPYELVSVRPIQYSKENGWIMAVEGDPFEVPKVNEPADAAPGRSTIPDCPLDTNTYSSDKRSGSANKGSSQNHSRKSLSAAPPINPNKFSSVTAQCVERSGVIYGQPSSRDDEVAKLFEDLQKVAAEAPSLERPTVDGLCLAKFVGDWYRAKILSLDQSPTIQLVDYGDVTQCAVCDLKEIPSEFKNRPQHLFKLKLAADTPKECFPQKPGDKLMLKPVEFSEETSSWVMAVENKHKTKAPVPARLPKT